MVRCDAVLLGGCERGGSLTLASLLDEYGGEVYVDLMHYYQFDLVAWLRDGGCHPAPVLALIEALPRGSRTHAAAAGGEHWREWLGVTDEYQLLAAIYDAINLNTRATGNFEKPPKIDPWPLPGREKKRSMGVQEMYKMIMSDGSEGVSDG